MATTPLTYICKAESEQMKQVYERRRQHNGNLASMRSTMFDKNEAAEKPKINTQAW